MKKKGAAVVVVLYYFIKNTRVPDVFVRDISVAFVDLPYKRQTLTSARKTTMMVGDDLETAKDVDSRQKLLTMDQRNSSKDLFISISGLIGAGKTTLATALAKRMQLPCFYEPVVDNTYLDDFYRDPARYSFPLQAIGEGGPSLRSNPFS